MGLVTNNQTEVFNANVRNILPEVCVKTRFCVRQTRVKMGALVSPPLAKSPVVVPQIIWVQSATFRIFAHPMTLVRMGGAACIPMGRTVARVTRATGELTVQK